MTRTFKRGYIEKDIDGTYSITISKVVQNDDFGDWEDEDEEEVKGFCGYKSIEEAKADLKKARCKQIVMDL